MYKNLFCIHMKTTINLPDQVIDQLRKYYPGITKTALILMALELLNKQASIEQFKKLQGTMPNLKIDLDTLRDRNNHKWQTK